jgi:uncharacterized pyridoxal phosphate-containing UPF0001 family protein
MKAKAIEERRKAIAEYTKEYRRDQIPYLLPKQLWRNVLLEIIEQGDVQVRLYGDDYIDEGFVKRIELRFKTPIKLSFIKNLQKESLLKAVHWILAINKAVEPPREESEEDKRAKEILKEMKEAFLYLEEMKKYEVG